MKRLNFSISAKAETYILEKMVRWLPKWVTPDLLTALAFLAAVVGFFCYLKSYNNFYFLWGVNICLIVHWFADSLDGKLARFRKDERPNYGFYVDHILDSVSAVLFLGGLNSSSLTITAAWDWVIVLILLCMTHVFLKSKATGTFEFSIGIVGPTEARILLFALNCFIFFAGNPHVNIFIPMTLVDLIGWITSFGLAIILTQQIVATAFKLNKQDRLKKVR